MIKPFSIAKFLNFFFPFFKSKEVKILFNVLEKNQPKNSEIAMFVGGCVRKFLRNEIIEDIDVATILSIVEIKEKIKGTSIKLIETGVSHGTITLIINEIKFEVTTLRRDIKTDGRHAEVSFIDNWEEDSKRRDLTINAIYINKKGKIFNPQKGVEDLNSNTVKFIGEPSSRIQEDYLRIIRYIRFSLQYSSKIDKITLDAIKLNLNGIKKISKERILTELIKIINLNNFKFLNDNFDLKNIFLLIFPEFTYLDRLQKYKELKKVNRSLNQDITLAVVLMDEKNSHEYFCHKYKVSNHLKNKLAKLSILFINSKRDINFFKKDLKKNLYYYGKNFLQDLNQLVFFEDRKNKIKDFLTIEKNIKDTEVPKFPYNGKYLIAKGVVEGERVGVILQKIEQQWVQNNYEISDKEINILILKYK